MVSDHNVDGKDTMKLMKVVASSIRRVFPIGEEAAFVIVSVP
jgi:hypothetical protein